MGPQVRFPQVSFAFQPCGIHSRRINANALFQGPARQSSLESRPSDQVPYNTGPPTSRQDFSLRRGSLSGSIGPYSQSGIQPAAYVPPPTFPGRNASRNAAIGLPLTSNGSASAGPSTATSARTVPVSGWPAPADSYPHRHSLTGAIPQHGTWHNDSVPSHAHMPGNPAFAVPATQSAYGPPPNGTPYAVHAPQVPFHPTSEYPPPPTTTYTAAIPPSSSFPHMNDVAAALPPLPPPPPVEMPVGTSTPSPMWPTGPPEASHVVPVAYPYPPPPTMVSFHNVSQPAASAYPRESVYLQELARPTSTNIPTYPLIDNRPSSSMGMPQAPERPYSAASTHYPSAVTSSFHNSTMSVNSALASSSNMPVHVQYGEPASFSNLFTAYPGEAMRYPPPPSRSDTQGSHNLPTSHSYPEVAGHQQSPAYPSRYTPAPPSQAGPSSAWIPSEPDSRPGRSYLRSLGVGELPSSRPPGSIRSPSPMVSSSAYTAHWNYSDPTSSEIRPPYPQNHAPGGYNDSRTSNILPPNDNLNPTHFGQQNYYTSPAHQAPPSRY